MSDVRNYEEYRAQALASLGEDYTVEDLRNEKRFRSKVLDGLGVSYETDDLVNFEKYRLKVLQGIAGGGGGSSDDALSLSVLYTAPAIDGAYSGKASRGYVSVTIPNYLPFSAFPEGTHLPFVIKKGVQTITIAGADRSVEAPFREHVIADWYENSGCVAYMTEGDDGFDLKIINANTGDSSGTVTVNVNVPSVKFMIPSDLSIFGDL